MNSQHRQADADVNRLESSSAHIHRFIDRILSFPTPLTVFPAPLTVFPAPLNVFPTPLTVFHVSRCTSFSLTTDSVPVFPNDNGHVRVSHSSDRVAVFQLTVFLRFPLHQ